MNNILQVLKNLSALISWPKMGLMDFVEIILIAVLVYYIIKWIKTTRAWVIVKGLIVILFFWVGAILLNFDVILWIFANTISVGITALIILFQPELRRVLEQLGEKRILPELFPENKDKKSERFSNDTLKELVEGTFRLAGPKTGALIVIEQDVSLDEYIETGIKIDGVVTSQLLINIFEKDTPLHDGAVIIRGDRIISATCYLPLSKNMRLDKNLGTRHRAGVGISEVSDSLTIIVSEETGKVSLVKGGSLMYNVDSNFLRSKLQELQKNKEPEENSKKKLFVRWRGKRNETETDE